MCHLRDALEARDLLLVYLQWEDRKCRKYLEDLVPGVVGVRKEHQSSRIPSPQSCKYVSDDLLIEYFLSAPICWHLLESHLKEDLSELVAYFIHYKPSTSAQATSTKGIYLRKCCIQGCKAPLGVRAPLDLKL